MDTFSELAQPARMIMDGIVSNTTLLPKLQQETSDEPFHNEISRLLCTKLLFTKEEEEKNDRRRTT